MAMIWIFYFISCLLFTSSQYIYSNKNVDCKSDEKYKELLGEIQTLRRQQIKLQRELNEQRQDNKEIRDLLVSRNLTNDGSRIVFTAYANSTRNYSFETIIFNSVITNQGGAYNSRTGVFTSPADGVYIFTWTHLTRYGQYCHAYLSKDGAIQNLDAHSNLQGLSRIVYTMATMTGTLHLSKGENVWIQAYPCYGFQRSPYNSFSGWKL